MRLEALDLAFGYRGHAVGRIERLELGAAELVALLGPNGGGKTTLFRTLLGLLPPLAGGVTLDGVPLGRWTRQALARCLAYVPQAQAAMFPFTVREVVLMGRAAQVGMFATPTAADGRTAMRALEALGVAHLAERIYTVCSGGERQLALIARALAQEPRLLVMDEPTASLDFGNQLRVLDRIRGLVDGGMAVLLSTHDPDHALWWADRALLLHGGRLVADGRPDSVIEAGSLELLYGVPVEVLDLDRADADARARPLRVCLPRLRHGHGTVVDQGRVPGR